MARGLQVYGSLSLKNLVKVKIYSKVNVAVVVKKGRDSEIRKSKVEIITDFIKLNDEIPVCVAATVDDLQVLKLQISDSMSNYLTSGVQHLKEVSNDQQTFIVKAFDPRKICCSKDSTCNFAYENELLKFRLEESKKRILFLEKKEKDLMRISNAKTISASCNFKTSKMEGPTKTDLSCQTLTSSNSTLGNPNGNIVNNTNDLEHLKQLNDFFTPQISNNLETPIIIKNSKKHSINSKTVDLFNKTSIKDITIEEIINELENDGTANSNQGSISCENIHKIDQCINFNQKIKSLQETISKQNNINITKTNSPTKERLKQTKERKNCKEIRRSTCIC